MYCCKAYPGGVEYDDHDSDSDYRPPDSDSDDDRRCNDLREGTEE